VVSQRVRARLVIAAPMGLAAVLCLIGITSRSLGFDEGATVAIASQHGSALGTAIARDGGNMAGYYLLLHVLIAAFGNGLLVLRLPSALSAVATAGLIAAIGARLFDRMAGLLAGVLAAVSLPLVYWAQTGRGYAPMLAFVCGAYLALIVAIDPEAPERGRRGAWIAYAVAMTLAMYCSFVAVLVVPAQIVALAGRRDALRRLVAALIAVAVCCVPLALLAAARGSGQLFWVSRPDQMVDTQMLESLTSSGLTPSFHRVATTHLLMWATFAAVVAVLVAVIALWLRGRDAALARPMTLVLAWCVLTPVLTLIYSLVFQPVFVPRNLLTCTPVVGLVLAPALCDRRVPRVAAAALVVALLATRGLALGASYGVSPEPWSTVTHEVLARARPGDCIAFYPEDARMAFAYYVDSGTLARRAPRSILPVLGWGAVRPFVERYVTLTPAAIARRAAGCRRMWFVSSHEGQPDGPAASRAHRRRWLALDAELEAAFGPAPLQNLGYASVIHVQLLPGR
jgi:mannosyltransferase